MWPCCSYLYRSHSDNGHRSGYEETVSDEGWRRTTSEDVQTGHSRLVIESLKSRIQQLVSIMMMMDILGIWYSWVGLGNYISVSATMSDLSRTIQNTSNIHCMLACPLWAMLVTYTWIQETLSSMSKDHHPIWPSPHLPLIMHSPHLHQLFLSPFL